MGPAPTAVMVRTELDQSLNDTSRGALHQEGFPKDNDVPKDTVYIGKDHRGKSMHARCTAVFDTPLEDETGYPVISWAGENPPAVNERYPFQPGKRYQDRGVAQAMIAALDKDIPTVNRTQLAGSVEFSGKGDVRPTLWRCGEPAVIHTERHGDYFVAYAGKKALWGATFQHDSGLQFKDSDLAGRKIRDGDHTPFELIKQPRPPASLKYTPLTGLHAALFQPFPTRRRSKRDSAEGKTIESDPKITARLHYDAEDDDTELESRSGRGDVLIPTRRYPRRSDSAEYGSIHDESEEEEEQQSIYYTSDSESEHDDTSIEGSPFDNGSISASPARTNDDVDAFDTGMTEPPAVFIQTMPTPMHLQQTSIQPVSLQRASPSDRRTGEEDRVTNDTASEASTSLTLPNQASLMRMGSIGTQRVEIPDFLNQAVNKFHELQTEVQEVKTNNQELQKRNLELAGQNQGLTSRNQTQEAKIQSLEETMGLREQQFLVELEQLVEAILEETRNNMLKRKRSASNGGRGNYPKNH